MDFLDAWLAVLTAKISYVALLLLIGWVLYIVVKIFIRAVRSKQMELRLRKKCKDDGCLAWDDIKNLWDRYYGKKEEKTM